MKNSKLDDDSGFALIEILLLGGIVMALLGTITRELISKNKELRSISDKLLLRSTRMQLNASLLSENYCSCLFRGNSINRSRGLLREPLDAIPLGFRSSFNHKSNPCEELRGPSALKIGEGVGGTAIKVQNISVDVTKAYSSTKYLGEIKVEFDAFTLVRALNQIRVPVVFNVDQKSGKINSCWSAEKPPPVVATNESAKFSAVSSNSVYRDPAWEIEEEDLQCPTGTVGTGFIVNTAGYDGGVEGRGGTIIKSIKIKCSKTSLRFLPSSFIGCHIHSELAKTGGSESGCSL